MIEVQTCTKCKSSKVLDEFYFDGPHRYRRECKTCFRTAQNERRKRPPKAPVHDEPVGVSKLCRGCSVDKDLTLFHASKYSRDGRHSLCKVCRLERAEDKRRRS